MEFLERLRCLTFGTLALRLAVGSGYYELGVLAAALVLLAETVINKMGNNIKHQPEYIVEIHYNEKTLWTMCCATARIMPCPL